LQKKIIFATLGIPPDLQENVSYDQFVLACWCGRRRTEEHNWYSKGLIIEEFIPFLYNLYNFISILYNLYNGPVTPEVHQVAGVEAGEEGGGEAGPPLGG
jgi:hypothetical protein